MNTANKFLGLSLAALAACHPEPPPEPPARQQVENFTLHGYQGTRQLWELKAGSAYLLEGERAQVEKLTLRLERPPGPALQLTSPTGSHTPALLQLQAPVQLRLGKLRADLGDTRWDKQGQKITSPRLRLQGSNWSLEGQAVAIDSPYRWLKMEKPHFKMQF